jgi:hypothetical protein
MSRTTSDPFTIGNVVSAGVRLYRDRLGAYFGIAFVAVLWWLLPLLPIVLATIFIGITASGNGNSVGIVISVLVFLVSLVVWIYGIAKSLANTALISRLAFRHLTNQPETISDARQNVMPRTWTFLGMQLTVIFILFIINFGLSIAQTTLIGIGLLVIPESSILAAIYTVAINLVSFIVYLWFYSHFFIPEVPLAIEKNISTGGTISRSCNLATGSVWRIQGIIIVTTLITIPLYILAALPLILTFAQLIGGLLIGNTDFISLLPMFLSGGVSLIVTILLFGLVNIFVVPLWQSIKAVIYYDLCSRREGLDLELKKEEN